MVDILDAMIDGWVNQIVMVIGQMPWLGPLLALIAGTSVGFVQRLKGSAHYERFSFWSEKILGALIFAVGIYMFWLAL